MDLAGLPNTTCYLRAKETRWHDLEARCCVCVTCSQHGQMLRRLIHETITLGNGLIWVLGIKDGFFFLQILHLALISPYAIRKI